MVKITCGNCGKSFYLSNEVDAKCEDYSCPYCGEQTVYGICHRAGACQGRLEPDGCEGCQMLWIREVIND